jgi:hypothetical protein
MTDYLYLASETPLPEVTLGDNPSKVSGGVVYYDSEADLCVWDFENNIDPHTQRRFSYSTHFSYKCQLSSMSFLPFKNEKARPREEKALDYLHDFIQEMMNSHAFIEVLRCWNGEENFPLQSKREIMLPELKKEDLLLDSNELLRILKYPYV